jgi:uncharacterized membrane protein
MVLMRSGGIKWLVVTVALGAVALLASDLTRFPRCIAVSGANALAIPLSQLGRGEAKLFCYRDSAGDKIRFILARGSDGAVHSVFDACRQCYSYRKGYRLTRDGLVCRLCGNRYSVDHMEAGMASCVPVSIPHKKIGATVRINTADVHAGRDLF